ncbi:hypothetical protein PTSG_03890 [Salpingoeca rosetta]|uniref:Uncharacterized protein n=1 Tax=Salpingoeca rosetta (strain ATCC 50818 / BSB-021) TaxID=946362 RepID=F2U5P4_SALR5|nr:uncharacterized protein PTSG_03890 [Salpingoeca rosetta]EGD83260.1 hypothetical protein PTSG_03890 [Salpingoeca rosetta]|eukprot:XP_004995624.1 hypothetical protein PTSG_03890 [Salpingoeca rosetta]
MAKHNTKKGSARRKATGTYGSLLVDIGTCCSSKPASSVKPKERLKPNDPSPLVGVPLSELHYNPVPPMDVWQKREAELMMRDEKRTTRGKHKEVQRAQCNVQDRIKVNKVYKQSGLDQLRGRKKNQTHVAKLRGYLVSNVDIDPNLLFNTRGLK